MPLLSRLGSFLQGSGWDEDAVESFLLDGEPPCEDEAVDRSATGPDLGHNPWTQQFLAKVAQKLPPQPAELGFDFLELYSGCSQMSAAWKRQGFSVLPPLELKAGCDLREGDLFWGIMG